MTTLSQSAAEALYGNRFLTEKAPSTSFPQTGMRPTDAMRLLGEDLNLEGDPQRNLATFVTTWMEPEAQRIIAENLHRNFIDHAEYPISAEIEQRCVRMLADLFNAPGPTTGCRTQGSSEAIMLGALSLKWKWKERRQAANLPTDRPNLVFGGDVHVVWEKFCRYFDVEPRIVPLEENKYTIGPEDVEPHIDENTIGVAAVLGTTFTGHMDDIVGINDLLLDIRNRRDLDVPLHVDGASGGFVWPFLYPDSRWDFRLEQVRSINVSGHKYGLVYPGIGWLVFREESDLAKDLVFYENYLGKLDATFTLNFSTGASMVLAQYYNFVRLGRDGYTYVMKQMQQNAQALASNLRDSGRFEVIGADAGAAAAGGLPALGRAHDVRRVRHRVAAVRGARLDGAGVHAPPERRTGEDHACAREGDHESRAGRTPDPRHRGRVRHPRREGRSPPDRTRADQDGHRLLTAPEVRRAGLVEPAPRAVCGAGIPTSCQASCLRRSNGPTNRGPESRVSSQRASRRSGCARY